MCGTIAVSQGSSDARVPTTVVSKDYHAHHGWSIVRGTCGNFAAGHDCTDEGDLLSISACRQRRQYSPDFAHEWRKTLTVFCSETVAHLDVIRDTLQISA